MALFKAMKMSSQKLISVANKVLDVKHENFLSDDNLHNKDDTLFEYEMENDYLNKQYIKTLENLKKTYLMMSKHISNILHEKNTYEDCPVCYEILTKETIFIPECCHYICLKCAKPCESCPICRNTYTIKLYKD